MQREELEEVEDFEEFEEWIKLLPCRKDSMRSSLYGKKRIASVCGSTE